MTDREIVIFLAEKVMGWQVFQSGRGSWWARDKADTLEERDIMLESLHPWDEMPAWKPLESIADAFEVQAALKAGQIDRYIEALLDGWPKSGFNEYWWLIQLTPRQRCLAIVEATR